MSKKPLAIILAFFIVFAPVYANAVLLPLLAVAASSTGRVLVGNAIKRVGQAAISRAGMASMAAGLGYMGSTKSAIEQDGWTIDYGSGGGGAGGSWDSPGKGVDSNGNIDIAIYKMPPNDGCEIVYGWSQTNNLYGSANFEEPTDFSIIYDKTIAAMDKKYPNEGALEVDPDSKAQVLSKEQRFTASVSSPNWVRTSTTHTYSIARKGWGNTGMVTHVTYMYYRCAPYPVNKTYITNNEFNAYLTKNITNNQAGDIIKNIYNYDYSQHPNITINNNTTGGNSLNNDLSVNVDPNADIRVSPRLRLDIESNKVNLDNVNNENCTKNEAGEYDNCTGEEDEEETDPDDPNNPSPEEPPPIECSANGFYKKICDWMDWTKKDHTEPTDTNVDVTDKTSEIVIDDSRISFDDQCPTPKDINITVVGHSFSDALDYQPLCDFFIKLKPFVVGMGGISSALIIAGGVRRG